MLKRSFDISVSLIGLLVTSPVLISIAVLVRLTSPGPALHWSKRVGVNNELFEMPKFRTMHQGTPQLATHLLQGADSHITPLGHILRKTSLDELPQLWSVLIGEMSLVGPRPALYNQTDLVSLRTQNLLHHVAPGLTGWAQINGRDEVSIYEKVELDLEYRNNMCFWLDQKIIAMTLLKVLQREGIRQAEQPVTASASNANESAGTKRAA